MFQSNSSNETEKVKGHIVSCFYMLLLCENSGLFLEWSSSNILLSYICNMSVFHSFEPFFHLKQEGAKLSASVISFSDDNE